MTKAMIADFNIHNLFFLISLKYTIKSTKILLKRKNKIANKNHKKDINLLSEITSLKIVSPHLGVSGEEQSAAGERL